MKHGSTALQEMTAPKEWRVRSTWQYVTSVVVLLAVAIALQVWRDRGWKPYEPQTPLLWMHAGPAARRALLGFDSIVADVYWIRAVVYFGRQRLSERADANYDLLYPLLDFVTMLDPRFSVAYRFGAIFLSEPSPGGPGQPERAIALLERGFEQNPDRWEYPHDIGFVYYWSLRDHQQASAWLDRASAVPGAPVWLKSTAAYMLTEGGHRDAARLMWRQFYDEADSPALKEAAHMRLAQLDALDAIDTLNPIVWRYRARTGLMADRWQELVDAGVLRGIPLDPAGVPFVLDPVNEDVQLSPTSPLWPLPAGQ